MNCRVTEQVFEIIRLLEEEKKKPKNYGEGISLYHAEAMFLELISRCPSENVSGISSRLGITKGAVTQISGKLVQKGLIEIIQREDNKKEKYFRLTTAGEEAVCGHQQFHRQANQRLCDYISTLNYDETTVIFQFLTQLKECVPFCEFTCTCGDEKNKEAEYEESGTAQCTQLTSSTGNR